jgi:hypothetical protein
MIDLVRVLEEEGDLEHPEGGRDLTQALAAETAAVELAESDLLQHHELLTLDAPRVVLEPDPVLGIFIQVEPSGARVASLITCSGFGRRWAAAGSGAKATQRKPIPKSRARNRRHPGAVRLIIGSSLI